MKANQLGELSVVELNARLNENLDALQNLRFQKALQQLEDGTQIPIVKKEIAQIKTILREVELGIRRKEGDA
ncbi:MAG: 50S ribosomal protein L29 [Candidatus Marinimicrobia bacterium]|jgi:large subunit ribosomal protein L29|nr:50S ribosomal protein L29 [Candidatus Neomarinimicrobiota bacterium]MBT3936226.1 50S ribosomal protein L29 [Candidatus Neomarinimicrobiota bacterium]MBT4383986.1 50S ribosomal protein L29 [Candidatus Neomarinimicrobiota bacterium]MBT4635031.1 50S ribosomal protein L29 [Candidatus Neomarinimicrobiota bacterium]MBT4685625.1 50S ribosomal protein L29 [Candidatus Neomarinimicrobiota bacterium]|tara:strand:- start:193 stop:408 length:216 start_codon:yes stop_codon:yes gene_type:complete